MWLIQRLLGKDGQLVELPEKAGTREPHALRELFPLPYQPKRGQYHSSETVLEPAEYQKVKSVR